MGVFGVWIGVTWNDGYRDNFTDIAAENQSREFEELYLLNPQ